MMRQILQIGRNKKTAGCLWKINMTLILALIMVFSFVKGHGGGDDNSKDAKPANLLLISLDGFRHDYLQLHAKRLSNLTKFYTEGVRAKSMYSAYITKTFPNHHTIVTGLYEETHGIVGNRMWDPLWKASFTISEDNASDSRWYGGEPMWVTNELSSSKRRSGIVYWPGGSSNISGHEPFRHIPYAQYNLTFRERIDTILSWFSDKTDPINLGLVYYQEPDAMSHVFGPESAEVAEQLSLIDADIGYLINQVEANDDLNDTLNIIILSDHGFAEINVNESIYLENCTGSIEYNITNNNPVMSIWPKDDTPVAELLNRLKTCEGLIVYQKEAEELKQYHYSDNRRISPILVSTKRASDGKGRLVYKDNTNNYTQLGNHGWNNSWEKMHAFFVARGPAFKKGYVHASFANVDVYPLVCRLLNFKVCAPNNGSIDAVKDMLAQRYDISSTSYVTVGVLAVLMLIFGAVFSIGAICHHCARGNQANRYNHMSERTTSIPDSNGRITEHSTLLMSSDDEF